MKIIEAYLHADGACTESHWHVCHVDLRDIKSAPTEDLVQAVGDWGVCVNSEQPEAAEERAAA
jgi:hypothetical protein